MLAIERRTKILELVTRRRSVIVGELSQSFGVTEETIRRDLHSMDREGLLTRTHGGAVAREAQAEDLSYRMRQTTNMAAKRAIAELAAGLVRDGSAVMIDSSSTAFEVLQGLENHENLTLITNSVRIAADPGATRHTIMSVGGELRKQSMTFVGGVACQAIAQFRADIALISCKALSQQGGVLDASVADAEVKRAFIAAARSTCLLVDGDKFDGSALTSVCPLERIGTIVTDRRPSDAWVALLDAKGVSLIF